MPIIPKISTPLTNMECERCHTLQPETSFAATRSVFFRAKRIPICNNCINAYLTKHDYEWKYLDKLCQWVDIPWIVKEWTRIVDENGREQAWSIYAKVFNNAAYTNLGWDDYDKQYRELKAAGNIDEEIPLLHEQHLLELQRKWGANYDESDLYYLEDLYKGLLATQNVAGPLQDDQAKKICKLSLEIDGRIRAGDKDVDKFLSSYDKLVKTAEFTPKNTKNAADFDSWAELAVWLEKRGLMNKYYDGAVRDVIDETLKNIETYNQKLYINEGGIGEAITQRLDALKYANRVEENIYNVQSDFDPDEYDNTGFIVAGEDDAFAIDEDEPNGKRK